MNILLGYIPYTYVMSDYNDKEIDRTFYKKELQQTNQAEFRVEKVIKRKVDKLCQIEKL